MEKEEIWRNIKDYPKYKISNLGRIKSTRGYKLLLKPILDKRGNTAVSLYKEGKAKRSLIHLLMVRNFLDYNLVKECLIVNHKNGIKKDNSLSNLEIIPKRNKLSIKKIKSSSYIGVSYNKKANKWASNISINGKSKYLGLFNSEIEAANKYNNEINNLYYDSKTI